MTSPADAHYDVIIVGAGQRGYVAAIRAAQLGMSVGIVEERYWGRNYSALPPSRSTTLPSPRSLVPDYFNK
jgi:thioredoxin reductase